MFKLVSKKNAKSALMLDAVQSVTFLLSRRGAHNRSTPPELLCIYLAMAMRRPTTGQ